MNFAEAINNESKKTYTENGALALNTTGDALLDLFGTIGALRNANTNRIHSLFAEAYKESPLLAMKCLFYARDIRGGLGERETFRKLIRYVANYHQEALRPNFKLIPKYGRWDDLYSLVGTPLEEDMWKFVRFQFNVDHVSMAAGTPISLMAKWLKAPDVSSKQSCALGRLTAQKLGYDERSYKRILRQMRAHLKIVERDMSQNRWNEIEYSTVPSRASMLYRNAFFRHDEEGFRQFLEAVTKGETKINASTLYPYDIIEKYIDGDWWNLARLKQDDVLEAQWKALPEYVEKGANAIVIADTSGSMCGRPMASALGLAIYFAEHNKGAYHGLWMSFSDHSTVQRIKGETLVQKLANIDYSGWGCNTNLERAFQHILDIAVDNHVPPEEMVKSIIVISDMEIDQCTIGQWTFYDLMKKMYAEAGYEIPNVVFWNVDSRHDVFHADAKRKGVQLCSGQSASTFKHLLESVGCTPVEMMLKVLNSDRYKEITVA